MGENKKKQSTLDKRGHAWGKEELSFMRIERGSRHLVPSVPGPVALCSVV